MIPGSNTVWPNMIILQIRENVIPGQSMNNHRYRVIGSVCPAGSILFFHFGKQDIPQKVFWKGIRVEF